VRYGHRGVRGARLVALALLQCGCGAGWQASRIAPGPLPPRQQAQVWTGDRAEQWHAVVVTADLVSGVPFTQSPACDSCRVAVSRSAVDSIRLGNPSAGLWKSVALGGAITLATGLVLCRLESSCQLGD
jgi:hypothetical protein